MHRGRVVFGAMDEVVFGKPATEAIVEQMDATTQQSVSKDVVVEVGEARVRPRPNWPSA